MNEAVKINSKLVVFKKQMQDVCHQVYDAFMAENNNSEKQRKGNFTWYNFDRSLKIEVSINIVHPILYTSIFFFLA